MFDRFSTSTVAAVGVAIGVAAGGIAAWSLVDGRDRPGSAATVTDAATATETAPASTGQPVGPDDYLAAWRRAHLAEVAVQGHHALVADDRSGGDLELPSDAAIVRRARRGDALLDQLGTQVTIGDADGLRSCLLTPTGSLACGPPGPVADVDGLEAGLRQRFADADEAGDYEAFAVSPPTQLAGGLPVGVEAVSCWSLVAVRAVPLAAWGQVTTECFDDETGALVWSTTRRAEEVSVFVATSVRAPASDEDLQPAEVSGP
ncbi:MAG: hypothetical protein ACRBI6_05140 [Acidimicrobiales bacterium]